MRLKIWVIGYGLLAGLCGVPLSVPFASNLSPYRPFPAKGSVLTQLPKADAGAVRSSAGQNDGQFGRTSLFNRREKCSVNGSKNIVILFGATSCRSRT